MNLFSKWLAFMRVTANQSYVARSHLKIPVQIVTDAYLHLVLVRMHEIDTAVEKNCDIV